jgi:hypothetical protein
VDGALKTWDIREFDQLFSSKVYGYKSVDHYYRHFAPINWIGNAKVFINFIFYFRFHFYVSLQWMMMFVMRKLWEEMKSS